MCLFVSLLPLAFNSYVSVAGFRHSVIWGFIYTFIKFFSFQKNILKHFAIQEGVKLHE